MPAERAGTCSAPGLSVPLLGFRVMEEILYHLHALLRQARFDIYSLGGWNYRQASETTTREFLPGFAICMEQPQHIEAIGRYKVASSCLSVK